MKSDQLGPQRRAWWKRPLRLLFVAASLLLILAALLPYAVIGLVRSRAATVLGDTLDASCRIEDLRFGWTEGLSLSGLSLGDGEAKGSRLQLGAAGVSLGLLPLLRGQLDFSAHARGLRLRIELDEQGRPALGGALRRAPDGARADDAPRTRDRTAAEREVLPRELLEGRLELSLIDAAVEVWRDEVCVESLSGIEASVTKHAGSATLRLSLAATAPSSREGAPDGEIRLSAELDASGRQGDLQLRAKQFDLGRYQTLADALGVTPGLSELAGMVDGEVRASLRGDGAQELRADGSLTVRALRVAGAALGGLRLTANEAVLRPGVTAPRTGFDFGDIGQLHDRLSAAALDLGVEFVDLQAHEADQPVAALKSLRLAASKEDGADRMRLLVEANPDAPGSTLRVSSELDARTRRGRGIVQAVAFGLQQARPLLAPLFADGLLTAADGTLDGSLDLEYDFGSARRLDVNGELTVADPRFAGPLLAGIDARGDRWSLRPALRWLLPDYDGKPRIEPGRTTLDLGFLSVQCLDAGERAARGLPDAPSCTFRADLEAIARLGGPFAQLTTLRGMTDGTAVLPPALLRGDFETGLSQLAALQGVRLDAAIAGASLRHDGLLLDSGTATLNLDGGVATLKAAPATALNRGPLQLDMRVDLRQPQAPFELALQWQDGLVRGDAAAAVRHLVPMLAGLGDAAGSFQGNIGLNLRLHGPARRAEGESWLQWLNQLEGAGDFVLAGASLRPAPGLQPLVAALSQRDTLAIDRIGGPFTLKRGAIEQKATRWLSKGREYGLSGAVRLDGSLDFGLDLTAMLEQHRDGRRIAQLLGDAPLRAGLAGTLGEPQLAMPDLRELLQRALRQAPQQEIQKQLDGLLQQGLEELLKPRKKKDG